MNQIHLLLFHGSIKKSAHLASNSFTDKLMTLCDNFYPCFLKGSEPDLMSAMNKAAEKQANKIIIIPMLLLPGFHIEYDIPKIVKDFKQKHPSIEVFLDKCLTEDEDFLAYIKMRLGKNKKQGSL